MNVEGERGWVGKKANQSRIAEEKKKVGVRGGRERILCESRSGGGGRGELRADVVGEASENKGCGERIASLKRKGEQTVLSRRGMRVRERSVRVEEPENGRVEGRGKECVCRGEGRVEGGVGGKCVNEGAAEVSKCLSARESSESEYSDGGEVSQEAVGEEQGVGEPAGSKGRG